MKKIVFIVGSLRKGSFNGQLAKAAATSLEGRAEVSFLDYRDIPYMDQDIEFPVPAAIERVRKVVMEADGLWFFTPEYNGFLPGGLKNLLDWLSRPLKAGDYAGGTALTGKKAAVTGVGGRMAAGGARAQLMKLLPFLKVSVMEGDKGFSLPASAFMSGAWEIDEETASAVKAQAEDFLSFLA